jgi:glycosyltransferase involved in cell wall biosynthesis
MRLTVIIPTYNRAKLLAQTLQSLADAQLPADLGLEILVVNNNSTDETEGVVKDFQQNWSQGKLEYLFEIQQGRSFAVNTGIQRANGDLISMIDDDIRINPDWLVEVEKIFRERGEEVDFVGGKVLPIWEIEPPEWVLKIKDVGICWRDYGEEEWQYGTETPIVTGGHAVFKAEIFDEIGLYSEELGVKKRNLISCEDDVMFDKLLSAGKRGVYSPKLVVFHYVPAHRLTKNYFRQWNFGAGMSWELVEKHYKNYAGKKIFGVPGYLYKNAVKGFFSKIKAFFKWDKSNSLKAEKDILLLGGFFYARNIADSGIDNSLKKAIQRRIKIAER